MARDDHSSEDRRSAIGVFKCGADRIVARGTGPRHFTNPHHGGRGERIGRLAPIPHDSFGSILRDCIGPRLHRHSGSGELFSGTANS